ncbi:protein PRRC2A-like [Aricia agestis]|uniref:protein PRRC2A-like n=1 Tax=Aricia agestis TaxID=91739 RepID=UPI001C20C3EE|nr:protein PRRC2A-like [Aricia agestis]
MSAKIYVLCLLVASSLAARGRPRHPQPAPDYDYEPQAQEPRGQQVVLVSPEQYEGLYRAQDRLDEEYEPRAIAAQRAPVRKNQIHETPKQPPVQTIRNYNKVNDDGSFTFGYEAADGSFKEETRGTDCVVRGKYGYVDPDGNKREFTYVSGNPCDPNKPDDEEQEPGAPDSSERDDPEPNYPVRQPLRPTTTRPTTTYFQNDFRDADEEGPQEEPVQNYRPRIVQRPQPARPAPRQPYQDQQVAITPRPIPAVPATTARALPPATTFRPQLSLQAVTARPQIQYSPQPDYSPSPAPITASRTSAGQIDFAAEFAKFNRENQIGSSTPGSLGSPTKSDLSGASEPSGNPLYSTELVYDPSSGQYDTNLFQSLPSTNGELNLNQKLQPYVAQRQPQARPFVPSPQIPADIGSGSSPLYRQQLQQIQPINPQEIYQRQQSENQFQNSQQLFAQQQQLQQSQLQRDRAAARAQAQRLSLSPAQSAQRPQPQYYFVAPREQGTVSTGQIDAFLRGHGIQL